MKRGNVVDRVGLRYGRLTVVKQAGRATDGHVLWACVCDCGNVMDRDLNAAINLKNKAVSSTVTACGEDGSGRGGNTATKPASVKQEDLSTSC